MLRALFAAQTREKLEPTSLNQEPARKVMLCKSARERNA
jgi:hypothetical protein